jgi:hypothetical protein|tara:strand:+ start:7968 stop:8348 length:381 start_codon:yes stop_codon:yes gene_type:complete
MTIRQLTRCDDAGFLRETSQYMDERIEKLLDRFRIISKDADFDLELYLINNSGEGAFKNKPPLDKLRILKGAIMPIEISKRHNERKRREENWKYHYGQEVESWLKGKHEINPLAVTLANFKRKQTF